MHEAPPRRGTNSIRLRVWVNPEGGWCGKDDVIAKAWRAQQLSFRLMIDFTILIPGLARAAESSCCMAGLYCRTDETGCG